MGLSIDCIPELWIYDPIHSIQTGLLRTLRNTFSCLPCSPCSHCFLMECSFLSLVTNPTLAILVAFTFISFLGRQTSGKDNIQCIFQHPEKSECWETQEFVELTHTKTINAYFKFSFDIKHRVSYTQHIPNNKGNNGHYHLIAYYTQQLSLHITRIKYHNNTRYTIILILQLKKLGHKSSDLLGVRKSEFESGSLKPESALLTTGNFK